MPVFECSRCNELSYSASAESAHACLRCGETAHRVIEGGFAQAYEGTRDLAPADHATHVYDDPGRVAPFCARYLTEGIDRGERVLATVPDDVCAALKPLLAPDVDVLVEWQHPSDVYGDFDADRVIAMYDELIGGEPKPMRILAVLNDECVAGVDPDELVRYEMMAHEVVTRYRATAVCMYDSRSLGAAHLRASDCCHPLKVADGVVGRNESFEYEAAA